MPTELDQPARRAFRIFWVMALLLLLLAAYCSPLERNQEARVLETAREMIGGPGHQWIFPRLNGELRLQKPPLAYWMAAGAFKAGNVSVFVGRLPFVLITALTLGIVYHLGRRWFSPMAGLVAAALTLASSLYQTYGHLAETDALSNFFVIAACIGFFDLLDARDKATAAGSSLVAGLCLGLAILSKGPPAAFAAGLFLLLAIIEGKPKALAQFALHGGLALALMIGLPWWLIVARNPEGHRILNEELGMLTSGADHGKPFWYVIPMAIKATLPWVAPAIMALIWGFTIVWRWVPTWVFSNPSGQDTPAPHNRIVRLSLWIILIFIPLMLMKQKQDHYFFPLIPPLMLLVGAAVDSGLRDPDPAGRKILRWVFAGTTLCAALATPAILLLPKAYGQPLRPVDVVLAIGLLAGFITTLLLYRRSLSAGLLATLFVAPLAMTGVLGVWAWSLKPATFASVARQIRQQHPRARFVLYPEENYRLNFELRRVMPVPPTAEKLEETLSKDPSLLAIVEVADHKPVQIPKRIRPLDKFPMRGKTIWVYGAAPE